MAEMRVELNVAELMQQIASSVEKDVQIAMHREIANRIAKVSASTLESQMRASGIRRAKETGTHDKRSEKEKAKANKYGSMLDIFYKVYRGTKIGKDIVLAGQTKAAYKARFRDKGWSNHHYWSTKQQGGSGNDVTGVKYVDDAKRILEAEIPPLVESTAAEVLANPKKFKRKYRIRAYT